MRILSANVNGIRAAARRGGIEWMLAQNADVFALQEVRATAKQLDAALADTQLASLNRAHAESATAGREGVAVLTHHDTAEPTLEIDGYDDIGRWIESQITIDGHDVTVVSAYIHTGEAGTEKQQAKYQFLDAIERRMQALVDGLTVVTGDFNVAHGPNDLKNWKGNRGKSGFLPEEQAYLSRFQDAGWVDIVRRHHGDVPGPYTWWSWRGKAFDNDAGWRIDYQWASPRLAEVAHTPSIGRAASYAERWSDHAAVVVDYDLSALGD